MKIPLFYDTTALEYGVKSPILLDVEISPHMCFIGNSGTGKTYALKLTLGRLFAHLSNAELILSDFKGDTDFAPYAQCKHCFRFDNAVNGLNLAYERLLKRQSGEDSTRNWVIFCFDEFAALISFFGKKEADEARQKLASLLMLARSFKIMVILSMQRADAEVLKGRDNVAVTIAMGNISKESAAMFGFDRSEMKPVCRGQGHILINGCNMTCVTVPTVTNFPKLENAIQTMLNR